MADTGLFSTMINLTWSLWTQTSLTKLHFIPHWIHKIAVHIIRNYSPMLSTIFDRISALGKMGMGERLGEEMGKQFKRIQFTIFCYSLISQLLNSNSPLKFQWKSLWMILEIAALLFSDLKGKEFLFLWGCATRLWRKHTWPYHTGLRKKMILPKLPLFFCTYWNNKLLQPFTANENIYFPGKYS